VIVVSDTTPLSELAKVGLINLLRDVYGQVIIPQEVYNEVTTGNHPAVKEIQSATWITIQSLSNSEKVSTLKEATNLGWGECAAMILAEELKADLLLIDDLKARRVALSRNLPIIGTVGTLLLAKQLELISSVKEVLDALIVRGKRISPRLYQETLAAAQE
jgi:predicted nucleic acid-binding protein